MDDPTNEKNKRLNEEEKKKRKKKKPVLVIFILLISVGMSGFALYNSLEENVVVTDGINGQTTLIKTGSLYGISGCENGGFSIQIGIDDNMNGELSGEEVDSIKNVCHGSQGLSGPMGNRGYWGYNGTNGSDGMDGADGIQGVDGASTLVNEQRGDIGPCPDGIVLEFGTDQSTDGILSKEEIESQLKLCFEQLFSGRVTDLVTGAGHSFASGCESGINFKEFFIFSGYDTDQCQLRIVNEKSEISNLHVVPGVDFSPGKYLGFTEFNQRVWFDAFDGSSIQLWSTNGVNTWKETNLSGTINVNSQLISNGDHLILIDTSGLSTFGNSDSFTSGNFGNVSLANNALSYNDATGFMIAGNHFSGELHSEVIWLNDEYWFIATIDVDGMELFSVDDTTISKKTSNLAGIPGNKIGITAIGESLVFDGKMDSDVDPTIIGYNVSSNSVQRLNPNISYVGENSAAIMFEDKLWFDCNELGLGTELCWTDGEIAQSHVDYIAGIGSSTPSHLAIVKDELLVIIDDSGGLLMQVDDEGINVLWDPETGDTDVGYYGEMWVGSDYIYMICDSTNNGQELYAFAHGELTGEWIAIY